jgi:hypothetical protein
MTNPLDNIADAMVEDILNTPGDELLREVEEDYGDPLALAKVFDQILQTYYLVTAGAFAPLVFCDDMSERDIWQIWHSYVVYPRP